MPISADTHPDAASQLRPTGQTPSARHAAEQAYVAEYLARSAEAATAFRDEPSGQRTMMQIADAISEALSAGGKLLVAGNGGSAADAQHISGEFTSRLMYDRRPLAALALTTDTSSLTAIGNDYGFEHVFSRQVEALGRAGDIFLGITTSGRSPNILRAMRVAHGLGMVTVAFAGRDGIGCAADHVLAAPSGWTPVIQQIHITAAHIVCALVERRLCPQQG